eukprot:TRINITY_DN21228_c0_g1_i1.p1 TRINITY_DN21228_c0_g1~~TRINITY_DN21228_c0_g1_i1.p1  ORF type:complete len:395 (+),score=54.66 TRINITY_DN21228_c0_g1_i1:68-1252(+)
MNANTIRKMVLWGVGLAGAAKYRELYHVGEDMEIDGTINSLYPNLHMQRKSSLPNRFDTEICEETEFDKNKSKVVTGSLFGDNGIMYRIMEFQYESEKAEYPFQSLLRCKNEIGAEDPWGPEVKCDPDYKFVVPLYHRLLCATLVMAESCMGIFKNREESKPPKALVLGLGGGGWVGMLQTLYPELEIDCVENKKAVVDHAVKYFGFIPGERTRVILGDAEEWVAKRSAEGASYDMIFVDLYEHGDPPKCMQDLTFYRDLNTLMSPLSTLAITLNTRLQSSYKPWQVLCWQYSKPLVLRYTSPQEPGAAVVFLHKGWNVPDPLSLSSIRLAYLARDWSFSKGLPFDVSKRLLRSASPPFPDLPQLYYETRLQQDEAALKKDDLRRRLGSNNAGG